MTVPVYKPFELVLPKERQADKRKFFLMQRGKGSHQALSYQENVNVYHWLSSMHMA